MVWFFDRDQEVARVETRFDGHTDEYVLTFFAPNLTPQTERFARENDFRVRLVALEQTLRAERWVPRAEVQILDDGWRGPIGRA